MDVTDVDFQRCWALLGTAVKSRMEGTSREIGAFYRVPTRPCPPGHGNGYNVVLWLLLFPIGACPLSVPTHFHTRAPVCDLRRAVSSFSP